MRSFVRNPDNNSGNTLKLKEIKNSDGRELNLMATRNYSSSTVTHMRSHNKYPSMRNGLLVLAQGMRGCLVSRLWNGNKVVNTF